MNKKLTTKQFLGECFIVDASILVKLFVKEDFSELIKELVSHSKKKQLTFLATHLLEFELLNVLCKIFSNTDMVLAALKVFRRLQIGTINPDDKNLRQAILYACENRPVSYYDASYHALAKDFDCTFLTADKKYYNAMKKHGNIMLLE